MSVSIKTVLGEPADVLIQKQSDDGSEVECCLPGSVVVRESTNGNVEVGNDTRDVIVDWAEVLCLHSEVTDDLSNVAVRSV